jgi:hypothetical protein
MLGISFLYRHALEFSHFTLWRWWVTRDGLSDTRCLAVKCLELVVALVVASLALLDTTMAAPWQYSSCRGAPLCLVN